MIPNSRQIPYGQRRAGGYYGHSRWGTGGGAGIGIGTVIVLVGYLMGGLR